MPPGQFEGALVVRTGSRAHIEKLRALAEENGLTLDDSGLLKGSKRLAIKSEEGLYNALGLAYIPPELREDLGEIEAAQKRGPDGAGDDRHP